MKSLIRSASALVSWHTLIGVLGGLAAFALANAWHYLFAGSLGLGGGSGLLPDAFDFLWIDLMLGGGCGYAGAITAPALVDLFAGNARFMRVIPLVYTLVLAIAITLIADAILMLMYFI